MTAWSLAYIVDSALKSLSIDKEKYQSLDNDLVMRLFTWWTLVVDAWHT